MKKIIIVLALLSAPAHAVSGVDLQRFCTSTEKGQRIACAFYVRGIIDAMREPSLIAKHKACRTRTITLTKTLNKVVEWFQEHAPSLLQGPAVEHVMIAPPVRRKSNDRPV
jgi:hypothetical protein